MGSLPWESLTQLRHQARIHRKAPPTAPGPSGPTVPLVAILPTRGGALAARLEGEDPLGIAVIEQDGTALVVLAGVRGVHAVMELASDEPALGLFQRRLRATKGVHVVMVAEFVNPYETLGERNQLIGVTSWMGRLIHAGPGSAGGSGGLRTKRSGCAA